MFIRAMRDDDLSSVRRIYETTHPDPTPRTNEEWRRYTILVACDGRWDHAPDSWTDVIGYTAADLSYPGVVRGVETLVLARDRNSGIGRALLDARLMSSSGRAFIGATESDNPVMRHLLRAQGMVFCHEFLYPNGKTGLLYASPA